MYYIRNREDEKLKQLINSTAPVLTTARAHLLGSAFIRREEGKIFYLSTIGVTAYLFVVRADGSVDKEGMPFCHMAQVDAVHPNDLGIRELKFD